jgi:hypothetical protein
MELIKTISRTLPYPIGENMETSILVINEMIDAFLNSELYKEILESKKSINFICGGSSGAITATLFCSRIPKSSIFYVTKGGESRHTNSTLFPGYYNIIVDDFIVSGRTVQRLIDSTFKNRDRYVKTEDKVLHGLIISGNCPKFTFDDYQEFLPKLLICSYSSNLEKHF